MTPYEELRMLDGLQKTDKVEDWRNEAIHSIEKHSQDLFGPYEDVRRVFISYILDPDEMS